MYAKVINQEIFSKCICTLVISKRVLLSPWPLYKQSILSRISRKLRSIVDYMYRRRLYKCWATKSSTFTSIQLAYINDSSMTRSIDDRFKIITVATNIIVHHDVLLCIIIKQILLNYNIDTYFKWNEQRNIGKTVFNSSVFVEHKFEEYEKLYLWLWLSNEPESVPLA